MCAVSKSSDSLIYFFKLLRSVPKYYFFFIFFLWQICFSQFELSSLRVFSTALLIRLFLSRSFNSVFFYDNFNSSLKVFSTALWIQSFSTIFLLFQFLFLNRFLNLVFFYNFLSEIPDFSVCIWGWIFLLLVRFRIWIFL